MPRRGKLDREWDGPYQVVEVMGPQTYRVRHHEPHTGGTLPPDEAVPREGYPCAARQRRPVCSRRDYTEVGTSAGWCRHTTIIRDEGRQARAKTATTWLPAGLHPIRKVLNELL
ncbi:hypothetical protein T05_5847 [Trichinella murrelli]|uniref:Integrase p58-like C-terminal domain-containing protein n=1 Tax=Trichinella murrelli TaxID=144512 RepID=A0A0V0TDP3_9BILA|nr:hypothetical protein T05_5847 [Trichinella murrelli]